MADIASSVRPTRVLRPARSCEMGECTPGLRWDRMGALAVNLSVWACVIGLVAWLN